MISHGNKNKTYGRNEERTYIILYYYESKTRIIELNPIVLVFKVNCRLNYFAPSFRDLEMVVRCTWMSVHVIAHAGTIELLDRARLINPFGLGTMLVLWRVLCMGRVRLCPGLQF